MIAKEFISNTTKDIYIEMYVTGFKILLGIDLSKKDAEDMYDSGLNLQTAVKKAKDKTSIKRRGIDEESNKVLAILETKLEGKDIPKALEKKVTSQIKELRDFTKNLKTNDNQYKFENIQLKSNIKKNFERIRYEIREINRIYGIKLSEIESIDVCTERKQVAIENLKDIYYKYLEMIFQF